MKGTAVAVVAILMGLLALASAHGRHGGGHGGGHGGNFLETPPPIPSHVHHNQHPGPQTHSLCRFTNTKDYTYDLGRLASKDLTIVDKDTGSTYYFNPCRDVIAALCPSGAAICEINGHNIVQHARVAEAHWQDGSVDGAAIDITYNSNKVCTQEDSDCKVTAVEVRCKLPSRSESTTSKLVALIKEPHLTKLILETPYACDVSSLCSTFISEESCNNDQHQVCEWANDRCIPNSDIHYGHPISRKKVVTLAISALIGFSAVILFCCAATCLCVRCRRAAQKKRAARLPTYKKKRSTKSQQPAAEELNLLTPEHTGNVVPAFDHVPAFYPQAVFMHQMPDGTLVPMAMPPMSGGVPHAYSYPMVMQAYPQQ